MRKVSFSFTLIVLSALLFLPLSAQPSNVPEIIPRIEGIVINGDSVIHYTISGTDKSPSKQKVLVLRFRENNIVFRITPESGYEYQYLLSGFDKKPSAWQKGSIKEYTNLPAGHYAFQTRFRSPENKSGELAPVSFVIKPLWYFSKLAIALYLILLLLLIWASYEHLDICWNRSSIKELKIW
jgi:hypothetical protein